VSVARSFDFAALKRRLVAASRMAFKEVCTTHPDDEVSAFALYSDEGAMTVCPAFDLASSDPQDPDARFSPAEWALEAVGAEDEFEAICETVGRGVARAASFAKFKARLFETCIGALETLRRDGDLQLCVLVMFAVSDAEWNPASERRVFQRLNKRSRHAREFARWIASQQG
jgi:hypothetical protein